MCMITLGILLAGIGFSSGGKWVIVKGDNGFWVPAKNGLENNSYTLEAFTNLQIINDFGDVEILQGDRYALETNVNQNSEVTYSINNGTLTVETKSKRKNGISFGIGSLTSPSITITVPKEAKINAMIIDSSFGDTTLNGLDYKELKLTVEHGDILLKNSTGEKNEIMQAFGDLTAEQFESHTFVVESEHGDMDIDGTLNGQTKITSSFGDTTLDLQNKKNEIGFDLLTSFGDITVNDEDHNSKMSQLLEGDNQLSVSILHGDLDISFK